MKNSTKKITGFIVLLTFLLMITPQAILAFTETGNTVVVVKDDLIGGWEYTAADAPEGYRSGLLMIVKAGEIYKVQVQSEGGAMNGTDVVVKGNDITFKLMVEGESVSVSLSATGSKISGKSTSASGTYTIEGVKSISPM